MKLTIDRNKYRCWPNNPGQIARTGYDPKVSRRVETCGRATRNCGVWHLTSRIPASINRKRCVYCYPYRKTERKVDSANDVIGALAVSIRALSIRQCEPAPVGLR